MGGGRWSVRGGLRAVARGAKQAVEPRSPSMAMFAWTSKICYGGAVRNCSRYKYNLKTLYGTIVLEGSVKVRRVQHLPYLEGH